MTVDHVHVKERTDYQAIEELTDTHAYFTHAYSLHECDSNENRNLVLQRFIPKRQPIQKLSDNELDSD